MKINFLLKGLLVSLFLFLSFPLVYAEALLIDDFSTEGANHLGLRASTYIQAPSRSLALPTKEGEGVAGTKGLMLKYDKKGEGGPNNEGGWCGYYTLLKTGSHYLDASGYRVISFQVKGATGEENFVVGVADRHWDEVGDSVKSEPIRKYLPGGRLTTQWQKASIPLSDFSVDLKELASIAICFEGSLFPGGAGKGTVYLDDLKLE